MNGIHCSRWFANENVLTYAPKAQALELWKCNCFLDKVLKFQSRNNFNIMCRPRLGNFGSIVIFEYLIIKPKIKYLLVEQNSFNSFLQIQNTSLTLCALLHKYWIDLCIFFPIKKRRYFCDVINYNHVFHKVCLGTCIKYVCSIDTFHLNAT